MGYFLGVDLGTSYFKAGVFDESGKLRGLGRQLVKKTRKDEPFCELQIGAFWEILQCCIGQALLAAKITNKEIESISYSSQANSFILLDGTDHPLTPLILWPDNRAEKYDTPIKSLSERTDFQYKTGLGNCLDSQYGIAKISWFQKSRPQIWNRVKSILSISDYLIFSLTGQKVSDYGTTSLSGLFDASKREWWCDALDIFNIERSSLPLPMKAGTLVGPITLSGARRLGLQKRALFCLGGLDHHVAAIGAGLLHLNYMSESTGTVLACVNYQEGFSPHQNVCIAPGWDDDHYFQMTFCENGAVPLEWYQKNYAPECSIPELLEMAAPVDPGCEGLVARSCVNRFQGLSGFENRNHHHHHGHFIRAILESTAWSLSGMIEGLKASSLSQGVVSTGGGAQSQLWIKIKADLLGSSFLIPECNELACFGAAMIGAAGTGQLGNINEVTDHWVRTKKVISPDPVNVEKYKDWSSRIRNLPGYNLLC